MSRDRDMTKIIVYLHAVGQTRITNAMSDSHYKPGTMDITEQERTFHAFLRVVTFFVVAIPVVLILLAMFNG